MISYMYGLANRFGPVCGPLTGCKAAGQIGDLGTEVERESRGFNLRLCPWGNLLCTRVLDEHSVSHCFLLPSSFFLPSGGTCRHRVIVAKYRLLGVHTCSDTYTHLLCCQGLNQPRINQFSCAKTARACNVNVGPRQRRRRRRRRPRPRRLRPHLTTTNSPPEHTPSLPRGLQKALS